MGKRSDPDPLVRILTDQYKLNILRVPRPGIKVGDLFAQDQGDLRYLGSASAFFAPPLGLPPVSDPEPLSAVSGTRSVALSASIAASPAEALMAALGVAGVSKIKAKLSGSHNTKVAFAVVEPTLLSTDIVRLGVEIGTRILRTDNPLYRPDRRFFIATSIARARGLTLTFEKGDKASGELALEIANIAGGSADGTVDSKQTGQVRFLTKDRDKPMVFGISVVEVTLENGGLHLELPQGLRAVRRVNARQGAPPDVPHALFGGDNGDLFVDISND